MRRFSGAKQPEQRKIYCSVQDAGADKWRCARIERVVRDSFDFSCSRRKINGRAAVIGSSRSKCQWDSAGRGDGHMACSAGKTVSKWLLDCTCLCCEWFSRTGNCICSVEKIDHPEWLVLCIIAVWSYSLHKSYSVAERRCESGDIVMSKNPLALL